MTLVRSIRTRARRAWIRAQNLPLGGGRFLSWPNLGVIEPRLNLLVIGSGKCGTTSLHAWLGQHPDIFMSAPLKEPEYFAPPGYRGGVRVEASQTGVMRLMLNGYRRQRYFGDASTIYTAYGAYDGNPIVRIVRDYNPEARLIYSIRNPFARIVSQFTQDIYKGWVDASDVVPDTLFGHYLRASSYGRQLSHWVELFPREQIEVVVLEEFSGNPRPMLRTLTDFLELPPFGDEFSFESRNVTAKRKEAPPPVRLTPAQFEAAQGQLLPDIEELERYLDRSVRDQWDMSAETWRARTL